MNAGQPAVWPLPDALGQPGPTWVFWALLTLTFVVHLLAMNAMVGGAVIGAVARWRNGRKPDERLGAMVDVLARLMPACIATTVTFGVAPLLFVQLLFGRALFTSSVLIAWWWLGVIPVPIAAYYSSYWLSFRSRHEVGRGQVASWAVAGLLVAVGFVYVNNMSLTWRADLFAPLYQASARGAHLNLADPTLLPRYLHMMLGAFAVGGLLVALTGLFTRRRDEAQARWLVRHGAWWFTVATAVNLLAGIWWLVALPRATLVGFMSGDLTAALVLALGVVSSLGPLALMAFALQMEQPWPLVKVSAWLVVVTVALMVTTRDQLRRAALASFGYQPQPWVATEWLPIALFVLLLAAVCASVAWMVRSLVRGRETGEPHP